MDLCLNGLVSDSTKRKMIQLKVVAESICLYFDQEENDLTRWNLFLNHIQKWMMTCESCVSVAMENVTV